MAIDRVIINTHVEDECCGAPLEDALLAGELDAVESWQCSTCGCLWVPRMISNVRYWEPQVWVARI